MAEKKITEKQLREMVRSAVRKSLKERAEKKAALKESKLPPKPARAKKLSASQLREMVQDCILDVLEEKVALAEKKSSKRWMKKAVNPSEKGEFTAKAKSAGMTAQAYADHVLKQAHDGKWKGDEETVNQAKFAKAAKTVSKSHKK